MAPPKSTLRPQPDELTRKGIEDIMKDLASQSETRGGESRPRTRSQSARDTNQNEPGSTLLPASRAAITPHWAVAGSSTTATGHPAPRQRQLAFTTQPLRALSWLFYYVLIFLSTIFLRGFKLVFSIFRYYMCFFLFAILLIIILLFGVYFGTYALQQWDSTAKYWPPLSIIGINTGFLTTLIHNTLCYAVFVQLPGYEICPYPSVVPHELNGSGQHWGLDNERLTLGPHIYPPFEEAFAENSSVEGVPSNVLRQIGFQQQIDWWAAQLRQYSDLDIELQAYLAREELVDVRGRAHYNTCYVPSNEEGSILSMQKNIHELYDRIVMLVDALREVQGHSMRFEGTFEATIKAPFLLTPSPPSCTCHEACKPGWWEWRRKRAWAAQEETRRQYFDSMNALRRILDELYEVVSHAASVRRDVDGEKMRALRHSVTLVAQEERCMAREEEAAAAAAKQIQHDMKWAALLMQWISELIWQPKPHNTSTTAKHHEDLREQRLALIVRVTELTSSTLAPLDFIRELLLERQEEIKQLEAYANAADLARVAKGNPRVQEHVRGLVALAEWRIDAENNRVRREERKRAEMAERGKGGELGVGTANS